ncbi:MAG: hypothetical protein ACJASV_000811 [Pseudorhodobacter sp.]|jgi:hypothetical protein
MVAKLLVAGLVQYAPGLADIAPQNGQLFLR